MKTFRQIAALTLGLTATSVVAQDCPTADDLGDGIVYIARGGDLNVHHRVRDDNSVWIARGSDPRRPERWSHYVLDYGVLTLETSAGHRIWDTDADLGYLVQMGVNETWEIQAQTYAPQWDVDLQAYTGDPLGPFPGKVTFRLLRVETIEIGGCSYVNYAFGARTEYAEADGSVSRWPGFFGYLPELMITHSGQFDPQSYGIQSIRKRAPDDYFDNNQ